MQKVADENALAKVLYIGAAFVTLFVYTGVSDPVNVTKLVAISAVALSVLGMLAWGQIGLLWKEERIAVLAVAGLLIMGVLSMAASRAPFVQNFYGQSGRQTGFLTYLSLSIIFLAAASLRQFRNIRNLLMALVFAGAINILYCAIALWGKDPIPWSNPYNTILGTFGNPDFISAFLGLAITSSLALALRNGQSLTYRLSVIPGFILGLYEIKRSHAIQGLAVTGLGLVIIGFFLIRSNSQGKALTLLYSLGVSVVGLFSLAGAFQIGPLTKFIYKTSVSLRGSYWHAGLQMAKEHPIFGVGFDTYGDFYRRDRSLHAATTLPGPNVISNASHNVLIDAMATNGLIYFAFYLVIIVLVLIASFKVIKRNRQYDGTFVALFVAWSGYQLQSIVSINQIGLAMWGWVLGGALIAYERISRIGISESPVVKQKNRNGRQNSFASSSASVVIVGIAGFIIGLLIALPPFIVDGKWITALRSGNLQNAVAVLNSWPMDSERNVRGSQLFYQNKQEALGLEWAKKTVQFNPDYYDAYMLITFSQTITPTERAAAEAQMDRLNPYRKLAAKK
jgi:O-antigen ligase